MELKIAQDLSNIYQDPLLLVFLDLSKAYYIVDQEFLLMTMEGYGAGPHLCRVLDTFWSRQQVVPRHNRFHKPAFLPQGVQHSAA